MNHSFKPARMGIVLGMLILGGAGLAAGCKQQNAGGAKVAEGAEGKPAEGAKASGPCDKYKEAACEKAGADSEACAVLTQASSLLPDKACEVALANVDQTVKKVADARKSCDDLVEKLCGDVGKDTEGCQLVTTQTKSFPTQRCEMMLQHYDEVLASLKSQMEMNKPLSPEVMASLTQGNVPSFGPADAKVTIVEFSDFECPFCARAAEVASKVKEKYGTKVRFVFRQYPLPMHANAKPAAQASLIAHSQGKFWPFHDKLFANYRSLDRENLEKYAKEAGLNMAEFKKAMDENRYADQVDADMKLGESVHVQGTPTMFLNGERVANPTDFDMVSAMIEKALGAS